MYLNRNRISILTISEVKVKMNIYKMIKQYHEEHHRKFSNSSQ